MAETVERIIRRTPIEKARQIDEERWQKTKAAGLKSIREAMTPMPVSKANIAAVQRAPQTILTKEQRMLGELFGQKRQFWGNGQPVQIDNTLTSGNGLIKTGSGNTTRRLMF